VHASNEFIVALSHDVDRVHKSFQSATHFLKHLKSGKLKRALYQLRSAVQSERYWCFDVIREIEMSRGLRSTYFFLNESYPFHPFHLKSWRLALGYYDIFLPKVSNMIRQLDEDGFEIGLHGSYRSFSDKKLMEREKNDLESILGHSVIGIRQHYLNLTQETWQIQRSLGFLYDASFGYKDAIGFKENVLQPFPLDEAKDFFIAPQAIMDCCLMRQKNPLPLALELLDYAHSQKAFLVLNWHQQIFDEREYPGYRLMYERLIDECLKRRAHFVTLGPHLQNIIRNHSYSPSRTGQQRTS
jgi:peptidoglycan/xylan/chitin deacetylase (PgdA/CDA1 family)